MKVVFFGTPVFAAKTLEILVDQGVNVVAVVTRPNKAKGRSGTPTPPPVYEMAKKKIPSVPIYQPRRASDEEFSSILKKHQADLFLVVAYGEIVKQNLLNMPKLGCVNVHASLLPKYRGAAPIQWALMNSEKETGITIMHMALKMDAGDIIKQVKVQIPEELTAAELHDILCPLGAEALVEVIYQFESGRVERTPQDEDLVTFAPKIQMKDVRINWDLPAKKIHDLIRGANPAPGAWCMVKIRGQQKRIKIFRSKLIKGLTGKPGQIAAEGGGLVVHCGEESLQLLEVQLEGKKAMQIDEVLKGVPHKEWKFI